MLKKTRDTRKQKTATPKWFYLVLIAIPIIFFLLLEISLRLFDYGNKYKMFVELSDNYPDKLFLNPELPKKYFSGLNEGPGVIPDGFDKVKKTDCFRIFVLGGSSAAGWPYVPNVSFSRQLKRRLELLYPQNEIEIINCGISAINSYTIRDFVPGIIEQKPDLILIYAGHNEYYGALGAASSVSVGSSRALINLYLYLQKFRTVQFIQNIIRTIYGWFGSSNDKGDTTQNETLMSRMIGESLIPFGSDLFNAGIEQYRGNMHDILSMFQKANIPVIISTLTSNLRELKPFVSIKDGNNLSAEEFFKLAGQNLAEGKIEEARKNFLSAKELDALRFRAPQKINDIIHQLEKEFNFPIVEIDSIFKQKSPHGIVGYNLTVDHLHPNIEGYSFIAKGFYEIMKENKLLPKGTVAPYSMEVQDSMLHFNFPMTKLDSTLSQMRIITLIGSYPFVPKGTPNYLQLNYKMKNLEDTLAVQVLQKQKFWETAHVEIAEVKYNRGDYEDFYKEMMTIIEDRPFNQASYEHAINYLVEANQLDKAYQLLLRLDKLNSSYYTNKWLGQIALQKLEYVAALKYLEKAAKFDIADSQLWYNLSGAYFYNSKLKEAKLAVERSLNINPQNKLARNLYEQLKDIH